MIQKKSLKEAIQNPEIISVVGELLPFTQQKNDVSESKKLLIDIKSGKVVILLTIEGSSNTTALYLVHVSVTNKSYFSVELLNSDTTVNSGAKFYIDKSSGIKVYAERPGCVFNVTLLQGNINYIPLTNVDLIPSSAELVSIITN